MQKLPLTQLFPWLIHYRRREWRGDFWASLALASLLIPEAMGYAAIAGLPPASGLHGAMLGLLVYALLGGSRCLAVSPTSASAAMLAAALLQLHFAHPELNGSLAPAVTLVVGVLFLLARQVRLGFLADFISKPVLKGFVCGLAITIMIRQLPKLCGLESQPGNALRQFLHFLAQLGTIDGWSYLFGLGALISLIGLKHYAKRLPAALLVLITSIALAGQFDVAAHGVKQVGKIEAALPHFAFHLLPWEIWADILPLATGLALVIFAESLGAARSFARYAHEQIEANRELFALGGANLVSGLFQCMTVGGGTSGTAANAAAGARTPIAAMLAGIWIGAAVWGVGDFLHALPEPVLAAMIIYAVSHLIAGRELLRYARLRTGEFPIALVALLGVPLFGILPGLLIAMGITLVVLLRNLSDPHLVRLGQLPHTRDYLDASRHPEVLLPPHILIVRLDKALFFANANQVYSELRQHLLAAQAQGENITDIIVSFELSHNLDVSSVDILQQFLHDTRRCSVQLRLARVKEEVREVLARSGFLADIGAENLAWSVDDAVMAAEARQLLLSSKNEETKEQTHEFSHR